MLLVMSGCAAWGLRNYEACLSDMECAQKMRFVEQTVTEQTKENPLAVIFGVVAGAATGVLIGWRVPRKKVL